MLQEVNTVLGVPGRFVRQRTSYFFNLAAFVVFSLRCWLKRTNFFSRDALRPLVSQMIFTGVDAMVVISVLALLTGFVFTFRLIAFFGSVEDTVKILVYLVGLEIGPLMTGIILIIRSGAAVTVDIGNMKLHREIESLEFMGIDIHHYIVVPRILAVTISQIILAVYYTMITVIFGILLSGLLLSKTHFIYLPQLAQGIAGDVVPIFVLKNLLFGLAIGSIACYHGLLVGQSSTEVPQQTQRAIVNSLVTLFLIDGLFVFLMI
ncbi:MAG: ABC transporter permease [Proteobacteria bacterium]|nr:ABC transporter permease [Pseudomonadota bacterium]MBU1714699.1 ABC transporter permease [Pseudomonadota bacterium]